eukprot:tig00020964_g16779.t1
MRPHQTALGPPHGAFLAVRRGTLEVTHASANVCALLDLPGSPAALLGRPLPEALPGPLAAPLCDALAALGPDDAAEVELQARARPSGGPAPVRLVAGGREWEALLRPLGDGAVAIEFEPAAGAGALLAAVRAAAAAAGELAAARDEAELCSRAAAALRAALGADRALTIEFDPVHHHACVRAEARHPSRHDLEEFADMRFPAEDVPRLMRRASERGRLVADVRAESAPVLAAPGEGPVDLARCALRAPIPCCKTYHGLIGVDGYCMFLVELPPAEGEQKGRLWGYIIAHFCRPGGGFVPHEVREAVRIIPGALAAALVRVRLEQARAHAAAARACIDRLVASVREEAPDLPSFLRAALPGLAAVLPCDGLAALLAPSPRPGAHAREAQSDSETDDSTGSCSYGESASGELEEGGPEWLCHGGLPPRSASLFPRLAALAALRVPAGAGAGAGAGAAVWHTESLSEALREAGLAGPEGDEGLGGLGAEALGGVLIARIAPAGAGAADRSAFLFWFRQAAVRTVRWAGAGRGVGIVAAAAAGTHLSPARSFARWEEVVRDRCASWEAGSVGVAAGLATALGDVAAVHGELRSRRAIARLNAALLAKNAALKAATAEVRTLMESAPVPIFAVDRSERVTEWSPACREAFGLPARRVAGASCVELLLPRDPAPRQRLRAALAAVFAGLGPQSLELAMRTRSSCRALRRSGSVSEEAEAEAALSLPHTGHLGGSPPSPGGSWRAGTLAEREAAELDRIDREEGAADVEMAVRVAARLDSEGRVAGAVVASSSLASSFGSQPVFSLPLNIAQDLTAQREMARAQARLTEAAAANKAKTFFLAALSHEMRTPLNGLLGMLQLAADGQLELEAVARACACACSCGRGGGGLGGPAGRGAELEGATSAEDVRDYVQKALFCGEYLAALIGNVLDLSLIEAGKLVLKAEPFSLPALVHSAVAMLQARTLSYKHAPSITHARLPIQSSASAFLSNFSLQERAEAKGMRVQVALPPDLPASFVGDSDRLKQVLVNLVSNSVRVAWEEEAAVAGPGPGEPHRAALRFEVKDEGPGLREEEQRRLFQLFSRLHPGPGARDPGGTGLGLVICKNLVEVMGGRIGIESEPGRGSTFWFTVQLAVEESPDSDWSEGAEEEAEAAAAELEACRRAFEARPLSEPCSPRSGSGSGQGSSSAVDSDPRMPPPLQLSPSAAPRPSPSPPERTLSPVKIDVAAPAAAAGPPAHPPAPPPPPAAPAASLQPEPGLANLALLTAAPRPTARAHVLVVEDNPVNLEVCRRVVLKAGHTVETAVNGLEAVAPPAGPAARGEDGRPRAFDCILMDCEMPIMDGLEATRHIREAEDELAAEARPAARCLGDADLQRWRIPIIALTAHALLETQAKCFEAGVDAYLTKPINRASLLETIGQFVALARRRVSASSGSSSERSGPRLRRPSSLLSLREAHAPGPLTSAGSSPEPAAWAAPGPRRAPLAESSSLTGPPARGASDPPSPLLLPPTLSPAPGCAAMPSPSPSPLSATSGDAEAGAARPESLPLLVSVAAGFHTGDSPRPREDCVSAAAPAPQAPTPTAGGGGGGGAGPCRRSAASSCEGTHVHPLLPPAAAVAPGSGGAGQPSRSLPKGGEDHPGAGLASLASGLSAHMHEALRALRRR